MKILFDDFDNLFDYKIKQINNIKEMYFNNKFFNIINKLLKENKIEKCEEILFNEFGDGLNIKEEKDFKMWAALKSYFCYPYKIYLYDKNKENFLNVEWKEDIFNITKEKLINILKGSGRKYLKVKMNMGLFMWDQKMIEIEN